MTAPAPFLNAPLTAVQLAALWLLRYRVALLEARTAMARLAAKRGA
ncbi:hypothetical protein ACFQ6Q_04280 [Streptomyces sp. NPDC056437]